jgi:hypothetical protein
MVREELTHPRIDVVCLDRETALGEKPCVDSGPRAEVEQLRARRYELEGEIPKGRARAAIRLLPGDLTDILRARGSALKVSQFGIVAAHAG